MPHLKPDRVSVVLYVVVCWLTLIGRPLASSAAAPPADDSDVSAKPRLMVVISIDQLCQDYLVRFQDNFSEHPDESFFTRVLRQGAWFPNCHYTHAFTFTAPGHSVQLTGNDPAGTGVIANDWFDRQTGRSRYCVSDPTVAAIGLPGGKPMSPRVLLVDTVGDRLKLATGGRAKVFGVAIKDRAAILMSGHRADAAFWLEKNHWVTSSYYRDRLPGYLRVLNDGQAIDRFRGQTWDLLLPPDRYHNQGADDNEFENPSLGFTAAFPHRLADRGELTPDAFGNQVLFSPFGNEFTMLAAREIIENERLGDDDVPDLLTINFSSNDYVGHAFGPLSYEVEDMTYRTDRQLADFARYLDERIGTGRWTMAVTADHGVAPIPERIATRGQSGGTESREAVSGGEVMGPKRNPLGDLETVQGKLTALLRQELDLESGPADAVSRPLILAMEHNQVYLDIDHPGLRGDSRSAAERIIRDWLVSQPYVAIAATREELLSGGGPPLLEMLRRSYHPGRSGDVLFAYTPYAIPGSSSANAKPRGTTHGSPWYYDTNVPLLWLGSGVTPGRHDRRVSPNQIAPTVARLLAISPPAGCVVDPLPEAGTSPDGY